MIKKYIDGKLLCATANKVLFYKKSKLYYSNIDQPTKIINEIKVQGVLGKIGVFSRLLRLEPRCSISLDEKNFLFSLKGKIYHYNASKNTLKIEHTFDKGMNNPLSFCAVPLQNGEKEIYYGEYIWNPNKGPVAIFKRNKGIWSKIYEFPPNCITHIHNIIFDAKRDVFFILTGDEDEESAIWIADRNFENVDSLIKGKQQFRSCFAYVCNNYLYYATDTPLEKNYLYRISLMNNSYHEIKKICELPGSCIYGTKIGDKCYFSTTVEPDSSLPSWRYRITSKLGKGIKDRYSHFFEIDENGIIVEKEKLKKDLWPMWLMQFGNILFPYNETKKVFFTTQAVFPGHAKTFYMEDKKC